MNLDDYTLFKKLDSKNMLDEIENLPHQLQSAWLLGQQQPLNLETFAGITKVLISGMGGSAIGADLLSAYISPMCKIPVIIQRDYSLPGWARGPETLVIASSHSGNTEETLEAFEAAKRAHCRILAVCTGGDLEKRALASKIQVWKFDHKGQPRAAVGFSFGLLLAAFARLELLDQADRLPGEISTTVSAMEKQQELIRIDIPAEKNPSKELANQFVGRWVNVYGSGVLAPVARRWKGQVNEIAKAGAGFEFLPEADHNALAGLNNPAETLSRTITVFLRSPSDHMRNRKRSDLTQAGFMHEGLKTAVHEAREVSPLSNIWTTLHFGDYTAYYLAMIYETDPTPVNVLENFKAAMKSA